MSLIVTINDVEILTRILRRLKAAKSQAHWEMVRWEGKGGERAAAFHKGERDAIKTAIKIVIEESK
jgi:hypothetical protein